MWCGIAIPLCQEHYNSTLSSQDNSASRLFNRIDVSKFVSCNIYIYPQNFKGVLNLLTLKLSLLCPCKVNLLNHVWQLLTSTRDFAVKTTQTCRGWKQAQQELSIETFNIIQQENRQTCLILLNLVSIIIILPFTLPTTLLLAKNHKQHI